MSEGHILSFGTVKTIEFFFLFGLAFFIGFHQLRSLEREKQKRLDAKARALDEQGLYRPPAPQATTPNAALLRAVLSGERDLLSLLPADAYNRLMLFLGASRRSILLVNAPEHVAAVLQDPKGIFPKNDLMVGALEGLVGNSVFVASGASWRRQRTMIDPAFSHMRINHAFHAMAAAIDEYEHRLDGLAQSGEPFSLDAAMGHLTADIICRTIFSSSLQSRMARDVFDSFLVFERSVANVEIRRLLLDPPFADIPQPPEVVDACRRIRKHIGDLLDARTAPGAPAVDDIAKAVLDARDPETGQPFTREEIIDQLGVFFLAGHETTASVLTWTFFILAMQPAMVARMREEIEQIAGDGPVTIEHTKRMVFTRNVFRETLRLYPPITFIPRVALQKTRIGRFDVRRGAMIMIAPWTIHRNEKLWSHPDRFDPDRFAPDRESELTPGAYLPFGIGPRICAGAAFATVESTLILARLVRRFDFMAVDPKVVRPVARLTTRPEHEIMCRVQLRVAQAAVAAE